LLYYEKTIDNVVDELIYMGKIWWNNRKSRNELHFNHRLTFIFLVVFS